MDLEAVKASSKAAHSRSKAAQERKRNILVLILRYLADHGYAGSAQSLGAECNVSLDAFDCADNIDLAQIVQEYEESYMLKFDRKPRLVRKVANDHRPVLLRKSASTDNTLPPLAQALSDRMARQSAGARASVGRQACRKARAEARRSADQAERNQAPVHDRSAQQRRERLSSGRLMPGAQAAAPEDGSGTDAGAVFAVHGQSCRAAATNADSSDSDPDDFFARQVQQPVPPHLVGEYRVLAESIQTSILNVNPDVRWDAVAGLADAKRLLKEAVVHPVRYPQLFQGLLAPWKGVLLYGPPGTGKTMLAKAVATECQTTLFNVSASLIVSKWRGESEKLVKVLFELARHHAPSTIFIDELDALMSARGSEGEHEASRRMKTELLVQMDGIARTNDLVFVLAATNLPWQLDQSVLRRLEQRVFVDVPCGAAREAILTRCLAGRMAEAVDLRALAGRLEGYSGSDITLVAKEAAMRPLRRLLAALDGKASGSDACQSNAVSTSNAHVAAHAEGNTAAHAIDRSAMPEPVAQADLEAALHVVKSTAHMHSADYAAFTASFGSHAQ